MTTIVSSSWTTASFSIAISSTVSPSTSVCSSPTFVSRTTRERTTFVASCRPPSPASTTATSTRASANASKAAAVIVSNCVAPTRSAAGRMRASAAGRSAGRPSILIRSLHDRTCGESVAPTESPSREQQLLDRDRRRRLPVRPDDVDGRVGELRVAELGEERLHPVEPEAVLGPGAQRREPADVVAHAALELRHDSARVCPRPAHRAAARHAAPAHHPENASDSACAITSAGVGGWRSISIISSVSGSPLAR